MATCLTHNQSYDPQRGEFCPYCGEPEVRVGTGATDHICIPDNTSSYPYCRICNRPLVVMTQPFMWGSSIPLETETIIDPPPGGSIWIKGHTTESPT